MPFPLAAIPLMTAGVKAAAGLFMKDKSPKASVPGAYYSATEAARNLMNVQEATGAGRMRKRMRRRSSDILEAARRGGRGAGAMLDTVTRTNTASQQMEEGLAEQAMAERRQGQQLFSQAARAQGAAEERKQQADRERFMQAEAGRSNLFGSAFRDVNTYFNEKGTQKLMDQLGLIEYIKGFQT